MPSEWGERCQQRIGELRYWRTQDSPGMTSSEAQKRDREYAREIRQWERKLFWSNVRTNLHLN